eukprot:CAMPEP_0198202536 /NCGR_PEP_ID=MMETSP1445-20131203/5711_1 /TAXON_ID=36898 /ORGANISM="Pyramimonas sp., Strain CCMP2087" /LENGTH=47 /DNA_ID= /DNA_START= /DNA_END= /DNA_ORIENTATION=
MKQPVPYVLFASPARHLPINICGVHELRARVQEHEAARAVRALRLPR